MSLWFGYMVNVVLLKAVLVNVFPVIAILVNVVMVNAAIWSMCLWL